MNINIERERERERDGREGGRGSGIAFEEFEKVLGSRNLNLHLVQLIMHLYVFFLENNKTRGLI